VKRKLARSSAAKKNLRATSTTKKSSHTAVESKQTAHGVAGDGLDYMHTIRAVSIAQSFDMDLVEESLTGHGFAIDPDNADLDSTAVIHARSYNNGDIFVFSSGTVVAWSVPADAVMNIATKQLLGAARYSYVDDLEFEDLDFSTDDMRDHSFIRGEEVVLGTRDGNTHERRLDTTMAKIAFSMGLARSTKLAVLENKMNQFLEIARPVARTLAGGSELSQSRQDILRYTGNLLSLRSQLNHYSELTDDLPDIFWDKESNIENYYTHVSKILDINPRIRQLNAKIDYANETVSVMREMSSEKHGHRLEWIIIVLISVEVLFELRRIYREEALEVGEKPAPAQ
jgi:required for meiotic nuclear division protein 1